MNKELYLLDTILFVLSVPPAVRSEKFILENVVHLSEKQNFNSEIFELCLNKLVDDIYADKSDTGYIITIAGRIFLRSGGYLSQVQDQIHAEKRILTAFFQEKNLLALTYVIAFGSLVSGLYYLIEISKFVWHLVCLLPHTYACY